MMGSTSDLARHNSVHSRSVFVGPGACDLLAGRDKNMALDAILACVALWLGSLFVLSLSILLQSAIVCNQQSSNLLTDLAGRGRSQVASYCKGVT